MANNEVEPEVAEDMDTKLWAWVRMKSIRDKDMSAALDLLKYYARNNSMSKTHIEVAQSIIAKPIYQDPSMAPDPKPIVPAADKTKDEDPEELLKRLKAGGMLRGHKGQKARSLLLQAGDWTQPQANFAKSLSKNIRNSALLYVAVKELVDARRGEYFAESLVESFDEFGGYTERQLEAGCAMVERETGDDPLKVLLKPKTESPKARDRKDDDDIPF